MVNKNNIVVKTIRTRNGGEVQTLEKKMTSIGEEEVMLDFEKGNLWLLLILQEVQAKEHKWSSRKEILITLKNL